MDWSEFEQKRDAAPVKQAETGPTPQELCARVFLTDDGRDLLTFLRKTFIERPLPRLSPEAALREAEARKALVLYLEALRDLGIRERTKAA